MLNLVVRGLVLAVPIGASVIAGVALSHLVASPNGVLATLAWYALILIPSLVVLVVVDHFARRFLPLAVLLRLSLVFPDRAPSRLAVALHAGNPRRLAAYLQESTEAGRSSDTETILTLAAALNAHDRRTRGHSERVRALTELVAVELSLDELEAEQLRWAAFLHDIGKLRVAPAVLNKRGELDRREWSAVRWHPIHGEELAQADAAASHLRGLPKPVVAGTPSSGVGVDIAVTTAATAGPNPPNTGGPSPGSSLPASSPAPAPDPAPSGGSTPPSEPSPPPAPSEGGHDHATPPPDNNGGHSGNDHHDGPSTLGNDSSSHGSG